MAQTQPADRPSPEAQLATEIIEQNAELKHWEKLEQQIHESVMAAEHWDGNHLRQIVHHLTEILHTEIAMFREQCRIRVKQNRRNESVWASRPCAECGQPGCAYLGDRVLCKGCL